MSSNNARFWEILDNLVQNHKIEIDRPKNTAHPEHPDMIYPLDYGYLVDTNSSDGEEVDIWVGTNPTQIDVTGILTVVTDKNVETKILYKTTPEENKIIYNFQNQYDSMKAILIQRYP